MKKLALFLSSCILAGTVHAVDVTKAEAATKIKALPATISTPGYYYLAPNINSVLPFSMTTPAITITASNVVLDLNGIAILANNGIVIGSDVDSNAFVTVQNGTIMAVGGSLLTGRIPFTGISINGTQRCVIDTVNVTSTISNIPTSNGIVNLLGNVLIKNCYVMMQSGTALTCNNGVTVVTDNYLESDETPILVSNSNGVFKGNTFLGNSVTFDERDKYSGNAFFLTQPPTGGIDIAGQ